MFPKDELIFTIKCKNNILVTLSPLANEIFEHSKAPCDTTEKSITLAWRRGIPKVMATEFYPHLSRFKNL